MPHERLRCLAWGQDLLRDIKRDEAVPAQLRQAANGLLKAHPSPGDLHRLVENQAVALSIEHSTAIQAARGVFEAVQLCGDGSAETLRFTIFTLRHYPSKTLAAAWSRGFYPTIDDWLARDG